jgi:hypothetical protein
LSFGLNPCIQEPNKLAKLVSGWISKSDIYNIPNKSLQSDG